MSRTRFLPGPLRAVMLNQALDELEAQVPGPPTPFPISGSDDAVLLQARLTALAAGGGGELSLAAGKYLLTSSGLSATLSGNCAISVTGAGSDVTELVFSGDFDGIVFTYSSNASAYRDTNTGACARVSGLSIIRAGATAGHDGLKFIGDTRNADGINQPQTMVEDVVIRGTSAEGGWSNNLVYQDVANTNTRSVFIGAPGSADGGSGAGVSTGSGVVIRTTGSRYATLHTMYAVNVEGCARCIDVGERVQGISLTNSSLIGDVGFYWNSVGRQEQSSITNTEFSCLTYGVFAYDMQNVQICNNVFYNQNSYLTVPGTWTAIELQETDTSQITGNSFVGAGVGAEYGVQIVNDVSIVNPPGPPPGNVPFALGPNQPTTITGNVFYNLTGQVLVTRNDTRAVLFSGNAVAHCNAVPIAAALGAVSVQKNFFDGVMYEEGFPGVASRLTTMLTGVTHGTAPVRLTADGLAPGATNIANLPEGVACNVSLQILGTNTTVPGNGIAVSYPIASYFRYFGTVAFGAGTPQTVSWGSGSGAVVVVGADNVNKGFLITVQAPNTDTWKWTVTIRATTAL